ncbi:hypothetical protein AB0B45_34805 [Nonomuraea sp. NPDC049152]|uniref:hypothetical protein n=1 Tax=Nonomuraea sp. NPDC049152 TaxID=3154350 RepID=UPI0033EABD5A
MADDQAAGAFVKFSGDDAAERFDRTTDAREVVLLQIPGRARDVGERHVLDPAHQPSPRSER